MAGALKNEITRKTFDTFSLNTLIEKQMKYKRGKWTVRWSESWLNSQPWGCDQQHDIQLEASH